MTLALDTERAFASGDRDKALCTLDEGGSVLARFHTDLTERRDAAFRGAGGGGDRLEAITARGEEWLVRWVDFRTEWQEAFGLGEPRPNVGRVVRLLGELEKFGPDDWDADCSRLIANVLKGVSAAVAWYDAVRAGNSAAELKSKFELFFGEAETAAKALSEHRLPSLFAGSYVELARSAEAVRPASGMTDLLRAVSSLPLPVPRLGVPVEVRAARGRRSRSTNVAMPYPRRAGRQDLLAKVQVTLDGKLLGPNVESIEPGVIHTIRFDLQFGRTMPSAELVTELATTYPSELFRLAVPRIRVGPGRTHVEVSGTLRFEQPQASGADALSMRLGAYLELDERERTNITLAGRHTFAFRVEAAAVEPVRQLSDVKFGPTRLHITARLRSRNFDVEIGSVTASVGREALSRFVWLLRGAYFTPDGWLPAAGMYPSEHQPDKFKIDQAIHRIKDFFRRVLGPDAEALVTRDGRGKVRIAVDPESISWDEALADTSFLPLRAAIAELCAARDAWRLPQSADSA